MNITHFKNYYTSHVTVKFMHSTECVKIGSCKIVYNVALYELIN